MAGAWLRVRFEMRCVIRLAQGLSGDKRPFQSIIRASLRQQQATPCIHLPSPDPLKAWYTYANHPDSVRL